MLGMEAELDKFRGLFMQQKTQASKKPVKEPRLTAEEYQELADQAAIYEDMKFQNEARKHKSHGGRGKRSKVRPEEQANDQAKGTPEEKPESTDDVINELEDHIAKTQGEPTQNQQASLC